MPETIDVPGIGPTKTTYVVGAACLTLGIVGYAWWRHSAAAAADTQDQLVPLDQLVAPDSPTTPGITTTTVTTPTAELPPSTIDEWSRRVTETLSTLNFDPAFIATTLGKFIGRQGLTQAEADLIRTAKAMIGNVPGSTEYPITLISTNTPTTTTNYHLVNVKTGQHVDSLGISKDRLRDSSGNPLAWPAIGQADSKGFVDNGRATVGTVTEVFTSDQTIRVLD